MMVLPLMVASILMGNSNKLQPLAVWIAGISPLSLPALCAGTHLSISDPPINLARTIPNAYIFWQTVMVLFMLYLMKSLYQRRRAIKQSAIAITPPKN